jgi:hypothetical protein
VTAPGRERPHNPEAERAVLGALLLRGADALSGPNVSALCADDFLRTPNQRVFAAAHSLVADGKACDSILVCAELKSRLELHLIGDDGTETSGESYVSGLIDNIPSTHHVEHYAKIVAGHARHRRVIDTMEASVADAYLARDDAGLDEFLELHSAAIAAVFQGGAAPTTRPGAWLESEWKTIAERGAWLKTEPPRRRYLLSQGTGDVGVLPLGRVGMLAGAGGAGKSYAAIQLALAVATGRPWLDTFKVSKPGRVLLALGEEDHEEIQRRLYYTAGFLDLTPDEREAAASCIVPLALAGHNVAFTDEGSRETALYRAVRDRISDGNEWSLLVFDPLSRFAGPEAEIDNAAATRLIEVFEALTKIPGAGSPTVIVAHHTTKGSRRDGGDAAEATAARGSSALTDGVRWQANLEPKKASNTDLPADFPRLLELRITKNNYGSWPDPLMLARDRDGVLRPATESEIALSQQKPRATTPPPTALRGGGRLHGMGPE